MDRDIWLELREKENVMLKDGDIEYTRLTIQPVTFEKHPEFNMGFKIMQIVREHTFDTKRKIVSDPNALEALMNKADEFHGEIVNGGENKMCVAIPDDGDYAELFYDYIKLYKLFKGIKHFYTTRVYRVQHPSLADLTDEEKEALDEELYHIRGKLSMDNTIVLNQTSNWDNFVVEAIQFALYRVLENPDLEVVDTYEVGKPVPEDLMERILEEKFTFDYAEEEDKEEEEETEEGKSE